MLRLATLLVILSVSSFVRAADCPTVSPVDLRGDQELELEIYFDDKLANSTPLQLYAGDTLRHSAFADHNGRVHFGLLPHGKYRIVIPRKGALDVVVLPQQSGLNGPLICWLLFPRSKYKWVGCKKVSGTPCPRSFWR